ncbi:substrate-binding domain-containing protein [Kribbella italica]|uniref:ABC-type phosphate transport system substrate-binding protein n=1 Tax=Kribbella italica TaxID=1540520 RepID=A0A7W9JG15_9ACTN|nr:substrate-binding domain-containing protein [Kribbella italica]MBB5841489.1 ABC-type phosphate transport system substrate-binding protein [Kribbella italica]
MRFTRTVRTAAVAFAVMAVAATSSALSAQADAPFTPDANDVVIVGSDTSEFVLNDLSALYNSKTPTPARRLASFNATGTPNITIRPSVSIPRPNGSGAGVTALCTRTDIDSARSSRPKGATDCADSRFLKFATDQLRWAANDNTGAVTSLTDAQLTGIYNCTITDWHTINPAIPAGSTIKPFLPQINSGTRTFWATQVGINPATPPACVSDTFGGAPIQEHTVDAIDATPNSIVPISVGRYNLLTPTAQDGNYLGAIQASDATAYDRTLFQVVKAVNNVIPAYLADLFGNGSGLSSTGGLPFICGRSDSNPATTTAGDIIKANGFLELALGQCGRI